MQQVARAEIALIATILPQYVNVALALPGVVLPFEYTTLLCPLVVVWYTLTELGSIVENAVNLGAPVPQWLKKMLSAAKDAVDKLGEEND